MKLSRVLEVSTDYLLYGDVKDVAGKELNDRELLRMFTKSLSLKTDDRETIKKLLKAFLDKTTPSKTL